MGLSSSNKPHFHFVCTNYGSNKDGIGHFTSKIVNELRKKGNIEVSVYSGETHHLSKLKLFLSLKMCSALLRVYKALQKGAAKHIIIIEYPFVEYNPLFLFFLMLIKAKKSTHKDIVVSLHEYHRTKALRKLFIRWLIPYSDTVLYTKKEDIQPFLNLEIKLKKRTIPANIEPSSVKVIEPSPSINICFFGIINLETKEINNMLEGWRLYSNKSMKNRITFHFISSSLDPKIEGNKYLNYHYNLEDQQVSKLLQKMQFMILPLRPKISVNNGSLAVCCVHGCVPVGMFDSDYFDDNFGLNMTNYSIDEFINVYASINEMDFESIKMKSRVAHEYGREKSVAKSAESYSELAIQ